MGVVLEWTSATGVADDSGTTFMFLSYSTMEVLRTYVVDVSPPSNNQFNFKPITTYSASLTGNYVLMFIPGSSNVFSYHLLPIYNGYVYK